MSALGQKILMDEADKSPLELLAKLAQQLASLQRECSELRREPDHPVGCFPCASQRHFLGSKQSKKCPILLA